MTTYRRFLTFICFVFFSVSAIAEEYTFKMDTVFTSVKNATYARLRVIDMRSKKGNIGELNTGALNRIKPIVTEKPLPELFSSYYSRMITGNRNEGTELLLVLYHFEIIDRANGGEIGTFYFDGDFFGGSNNKYAFLGKVDSIYEVTSGWDVTQVLLRSTKTKIGSLLSRYALHRLSKDNNFTEQQTLGRREQAKQQYPIYNSPGFQKGIYYTIDQFLNNTPIDTPFIKSVQQPWDGKKQTYFYYPNSKGKKGKLIKADTYFAIYDGEEWSVPGHFYAETMRFKNGEFYANISFRGVSDKATATAAGVIMG
ncbi:MAG: hypothetical protein K0R82_2708, partial [Flavipsychrobacter sp.]|nr:hypothetical protein [Flavipsychrobacter sp.]